MTKATTYKQAVEQWSSERNQLGYVEPFTAVKSKQKAMLLAPSMGDMQLEEITPDLIARSLVELGTEGGRKGNGLSSATLRAVHLAGSQAFKWAISRGLAESNPFDNIARPKANYRQSQFLNAEQAALLAKNMGNLAMKAAEDGDAREASFSLAVCIALATGMRRGEIFALRWEDVDFERRRIAVSKAIKADGNLGTPKSQSSIRSVAIGDKLASILRTVRDKCDTQSGSPIIADSKGDRASMYAFDHWWRRWADENGYEGLRFHELRHSHATLLIAGGTDVKTVQMRLGHASAEITMGIYAHAIPLSDTIAASNLDGQLFGKRILPDK